MGVAAARPDRATEPNESPRLREVGEFIRAHEAPLRAATALLHAAGPSTVASRVAGGSMGTSLPDGTAIQIAPGVDPVGRGDVIAFLAAEKTFVHRVRWRGVGPIASRWLLAQGDALRLPDLPVPREAVVGRVELAEGSARHRLPRRDRVLSALVLALGIVLLEIHPRLASAFIGALRRAELRLGWTEVLLYRRRDPAARAATAHTRGHRLVLALATAACRVGASFARTVERRGGRARRWWDSAQRLLGAACAEALDTAEKGQLTVRIYDFFPGYYRAMTDTLHPWEGPWFARRLPPPPASILVGASGIGREAVVLARQGYRIDAIEPAPDFVAATRRVLDPAVSVHPLSYETMNALVLDPAPAPHPLRTARYDAILFGSGSVTHVLEQREQERLLLASNTLCPRGPILASFFCRQDETAPPEGGAMRLGRRLGRAVAALRGLPAQDTTRLSYRPHSGFAYTYTRAEVERLAACARRRVEWEPGTTGDFCCVTFLATDTAPAA